MYNLALMAKMYMPVCYSTLFDPFFRIPDLRPE